MANPTNAAADNADEDRCHLCRVAAAGKPWDDRQQGSDQEADQREARCAPRRAQSIGIDAELFPGVNRQGGLGYPHDVGGRIECDLAGHAVAFVHRRQLGSLRLGVVHQFAALDVELAVDQLVLCGDADPLPGGHAGRTGDRTGQSGEADNGGVDTRAREADHQRDIRHQAIADTEDRGTGEPAGNGAVTGVRLCPTSERAATHFLDATD